MRSKVRIGRTPVVGLRSRGWHKAARARTIILERCTMRAIAVERPGGDFVAVERAVPYCVAVADAAGLDAKEHLMLARAHDWNLL